MFATKFNIQIIINERKIKKTLHLHINEVLGRLTDIIQNPETVNNIEINNKILTKSNVGLLSPISPSLMKMFWDNLFLGFYDISIFTSKRNLDQSHKICSLILIDSVVISLFRATYSTDKQYRIGERISHILQKFLLILDEYSISLEDFEEQNQSKSQSKNITL